MRIVIEKSILKVIEQKCKPEAGRDYFLPRDLVNPIRLFIDKELEQFNPKLYNLYKNRNYRGTDERTLRHAWGRGEKNQDGAIKELRDLLCYFGFRKNWDDTLKQVGLEHKNIQENTLTAKALNHIVENTPLQKFDESHFAKKIYIELITRKAAIPIDLENDVIEEIYNSWYKLFCAIREEMKSLPPNYFKRQIDVNSSVELAFKILNEILRPHLTEHQAKYRRWLENEKKKKNQLSPQELQKCYPDYNILFNSLQKVNLKLLESAKILQDFCV